MLKKTLLIFCIILCSNSYAQTKQVTEDWILQKVRKYYGDSKPAEFYFDGSNFNIVWKNISDLVTKQHFIIPVWAMSSVTLVNESGSAKMNFYVQKYCKECREIVEGRKKRYKTEYYYTTKYGWEQGRQVSRQVEKSRRVPDGYTTYRNEKPQPGSFQIRFKSSDAEEDFINRFNKAIKHLQTLYPKKPASSEAF